MKEFVVLYIVHRPTQEVYYLRKIAGKIPKLDNKLVGLGGKVEKGEDIFEATIREIKEELDLEIIKKNLQYKGILYELDENKKIHFFTLILENRLEEKNIEREGKTAYLPITHHLIHPSDFPAGDPQVLNEMFRKDEFFELSCKAGKIISR